VDLLIFAQKKSDRQHPRFKAHTLLKLKLTASAHTKADYLSSLTTMIASQEYWQKWQ